MNREISERISKTLIGKYGKDSRRVINNVKNRGIHKNKW